MPFCFLSQRSCCLLNLFCMLTKSYNGIKIFHFLCCLSICPLICVSSIIVFLPITAYTISFFSQSFINHKFSNTLVTAVMCCHLPFIRNLSSNNIRGPIPVELSRIGNLDTLYVLTSSCCKLFCCLLIYLLGN